MADAAASTTADATTTLGERPHPASPTARLSGALKQIRLVAEQVETDGNLRRIFRELNAEMTHIGRSGDGRPEPDNRTPALTYASVGLLLLTLGGLVGYVVGVMV